ncbi:hypothetical protein KGM_203579 [Danaus plexippus plexippus]|uniref:Uncharacterized protein n=1 Tax=Danaus plexippus plexippus TaxID=278856 RepID=A0A212FKJ5_DANPL|nr:hypothetical protein KGM_203579 [Danaus plexippus plexippus]
MYARSVCDVTRPPLPGDRVPRASGMRCGRSAAVQGSPRRTLFSRWPTRLRTYASENVVTRVARLPLGPVSCARSHYVGVAFENAEHSTEHKYRPRAAAGRTGFIFMEPVNAPPPPPHTPTYAAVPTSEFPRPNACAKPRHVHTTLSESLSLGA